MVLNGNARGPAADPDFGSRGVTLVELLIAISLSSLVVMMAMALFKDAGFAARLLGGRRDAASRSQALFSSISENLMAGGGILRLAPDHLEILNVRNRKVDYRWEDSAITVNGKTWNLRLASMHVEPEGPSRPAWREFSGIGPWELDSLDGNRDGAIDFAELDRDHSGELEPEECRFIARIRISMVVIDHGIPIGQSCIVHPRNRVPAAAGDDVQEILESGGIPEP
jgi:prepilin-type N-terminal cleavage/methylation domain-containing protein